RAMEPYLSQDLLYRPKMGFAVPLTRWFRGPLRERVRTALLGPVMLDCGYFERGQLTRLIADHEAARRDHSAALWALLMFEGYLRRAADTKAYAPAPRMAVAG